MTSNPFRIGDPVMDAAQGRAMVVLDAPDQTVAEWSDANGYDLEGNYANGKFDPAPDEPVVECVYVSDVRSEPSKTYTFPASRCVLIDAHHADDGRRVADRVLVEALADVFAVVRDLEDTPDADRLATVFTVAGIDDAVVDLARELADVEQTVAADD
jgi:hypothetical protein